MLHDPWIAALVSLFIWWFSTGVILVVVKLADRNGPRASVLATLACLPVFALGVWGVMATAQENTVSQVYIGFLSALALWGWIEMAFLTGVITGPNTQVCPIDRPEWERFIRACGTIAFHEVLLISVLIMLWVYSDGADNAVALWTFAMLFFARISAKLNLFLGVPKINTEFLPSALAHLPSHFRISPMNWLFPISITVLSLAVACWIERIFSATTAAETVGFSLLAAMTALALLEHWFMVLPLPDEKLWRWMIPAPKQTITQERRPEDAHGL